MLSSVAPSLVVERPYPGLRPFESHEAFLFRGRELHTQALLDRLASEHFLAVVGTSGSGKSSLVRAGLLPALYRGYLVGASTHWRIAVMRPGGAPLAELDRALSEPQALGPHTCPEDGERTSLDVTRAVRKANLPAGTNFLLVVDQFEELFRFESERRSSDGGAEASLFVQNLLEAADSYDGKIYVVLTVRSDFLGRCAQFSGLPEALNRAQYLIPHLTREQRQQAIELPPQLAGVSVKPALVQQLLNDLGDNPAMLPVLQHALMRTFSERKSGDHELTFEHYRDAGGIASALNDHAESLVKQLADGPRRHVERLFRCLTTVEGGRPVRRPARLDRIYAVLGVADDAEGRREVDAVVRTFAAEENSLLVCSTGNEFTASSVIDVSHETLIQNWAALKGWLQAEIRSVEWFRSVAGDCVRYREGEASPWRDPELKRALALRDDDRWNEAWAEQYMPKENGNPAFGDVMRFLGVSVATQREDEERKEAARKKELDDARALAAAVGRGRKLYLVATVALVVVLLLGGLAAYLSWAGRRAERLQAQRELELRQQVTSLASTQDEQKSKLRDTEEALSLAAKDSELAKELLKQKTELEQRVSNLSEAQAKLQGQLKNPAQGPKSSYSESLIAISDLQAQVKEAREERDKLQSQIDAYATQNIRDVPYWRSRAETAEAENKKLKEALASKSGAANSPAAKPLSGEAASIQDPGIQKGIADWRRFAADPTKGFAEYRVTSTDSVVFAVQPGECKPISPLSDEPLSLLCSVLVEKSRTDRMSRDLTVAWSYKDTYERAVAVSRKGLFRDSGQAVLDVEAARQREEQQRQLGAALVRWVSDIRSRDAVRAKNAVPPLDRADQIGFSGAQCDVFSTLLPVRAKCTISFSYRRGTVEQSVVIERVNDVVMARPVTASTP